MARSWLPMIGCPEYRQPGDRVMVSWLDGNVDLTFI
jgi:hypothetical protein